MPRRRLHGRTQERRKKPRTRLLKRTDSPQRVQATQQPAPVERSPQVERDDLEFLEAMRELEVARSPWRGDSVARRQAVERVQFLAEDGERALFQRAMAQQGVAPLQGGALAAAAGATPGAAPDEPAPADDPPSAATRRPESGNGGRPDAAADRSARSADGATAAPSSRPAAPGTEFEASEDAQGLMDSLLNGEGFAPELKFAGAAAPPRSTGARPAWEDAEAEPDDELDLHGKTQEEAIHMVQNYLLVCQRQRLRHVLIITGRGHNSGAAGPVLKEAVFRWLELNGKRFARAFARAPARLGGDGAIWVTLR
jgi:DNA-nicking Smr family endonuclease